MAARTPQRSKRGVSASAADAAVTADAIAPPVVAVPDATDRGTGSAYWTDRMVAFSSNRHIIAMVVLVLALCFWHWGGLSIVDSWQGYQSLDLRDLLVVFLVLALAFFVHKDFAKRSRGAGFKSFVASLRASKIVGGVLKLTKQAGHSEPSILDLGKTAQLFVRNSYVQMWDRIDRMRKTGERYFLVGGNAGVGKSTFLAYVLKRFLDLPQPPPAIVYQGVSGKQHIVHGRGDSVDDLLGRRDTVYLVDAGERSTAQICAAFTVVVASPHSAYSCTKEWRKHSNPEMLFMPTWSLDELQQCRLKLHLAITEDEVKRREELYGGIARTVFELKAALVDANFDAALYRCDLQLMAANISYTLEDLPAHASMLLHMIVDDEFNIVGIKFATKHVAEQVWLTASKQSINSIVKFISKCNRPLFGAARGNLFEPLAHWMLQLGGQFTVSKISIKFGNTNSQTRGANETIQWTASTAEKAIHTAADIKKLKIGEYGKPGTSIFPTIDAVLSPNALFQITAGASHDVNIAGLVAAVNALGLAKGGNARLYFVVPEDTYATFKVGSFTPKEDQWKIPKNVEFFVLRLYTLATVQAATIGTAV